MIKAVVDNKVVEVIEVREYEYDTDLIEIFFMYRGITRVGAVIPKGDLIDERDAVTKACDELEALVDAEYDVTVSYEGADDDALWMFIEADRYTVNVLVDADGFTIDTMHIENSKKGYGMYEDNFKNYAQRKTLKGAFNYIKKFMD